MDDFEWQLRTAEKRASLVGYSYVIVCLLVLLGLLMLF
jgi:hypothetical protein